MRKILIVDDELLVADTLGIIFNSHGFETQTAYSAATALICAREFKPDLLVCDIVMPGRNGFDLMLDISRELPDCRMLVLSAQHAHSEAVAEQSRSLPRQTGFLTKPCHPLDVLREAGAILSAA